MISKRHITILGLLLIFIISGYMLYNSHATPKFYSKDDLKNIKPGHGIVGNSEFELESGWYQKSVSNFSNSALFGSNRFSNAQAALMGVSQYMDKNKYNDTYTSTSNKAAKWHVISNGALTIENVTVKTILLGRIDNTETIKYYFFEKNGKYYQIFMDICDTSGSMQYFNEHRNYMDKTIERIVKTIH
ncbi:MULTISPECIES: hypothetical protein [Methanobacterium]|uniref:PsbP C-terminal domain-containing protein n=1 Tax=Methanobacterium bryantii TaxID=2161 RepID=A0A2A2H3F8_METBR|nr:MULTISPECIES: hypothetical protein [Methanobacterium]OEC86671.1 hypothetical protein A9507_09455 [Methanobacterium sp. A39]PAV03949.1 hypothetical protein ASJ80_02730 [Methanobacterium bryantii]